MAAPTETKKLYWADAFATSFEAEAARPAEFRGKPSVVVDRTVFYPESGGQLGDRGWLEIGGARTRVIDTQIDEAGVIHHVLEAPLPAAGATVRGEIDVELRVAQRLQHTAQHMLSRALADVANAATVSARLGSASSTIDIGLERVDDALVASAEDLVNAVIRDDLVVRAFFPTAEELDVLPLRRAPKVKDDVRVVAVGDERAPFDVTPCGGTHVARTGQIGAVRVIATERYKGMVRVTFLAGGRALDDARAKDRALAGMARDLSCGPFDVAQALSKLRAELKAEREAAAKLRGEIAELEGERLLAATAARPGFTAIVAMVADADVARARALAGKLATRPDVLAVVCAGPTGDEAPVVIQRGASVAIDCGALFKRVAAAVGGKGGGSAQRAEGRLRAPISRETLVNALPLAES